jgi:hypothetical protein
MANRVRLVPKGVEVEDNAEAVVPKVGTGVSLYFWSDSKAATVVEVSASTKTIIVQRDRSIRTDSNGLSDDQSYRYERDEFGTTDVARWSAARGCYKTKGGVIIGAGRRSYYDPSF